MLPLPPPMDRGWPNAATRRWLPFAVIAVFSGAVAIALHTIGFIGISDDDAARTLIAADFARTPSLDPTRSSWLPVHTYVLGASLSLTREIWWTPRVFSLVSAVAAGSGAFVLARVLGATRPWATAGALVSLTFPWSLFCAWAPGVPELPCTALLVWSAVLLVREHARERELDTSRVALAALLLGLACGHRYEAWFAAAGVCVAAAILWRRHPRVVAVLIGVTALVPLGWLVINHARTGHVFDFVERVAYYRSHDEIRVAGDGLVHGRWRQLAALGSLAGLLVLSAAWARRVLSVRTAFPIAGAAGAVALLTLAEALGGGATHHPARSLLPVVWLLAPVAYAGLSRAWTEGGTRRRAIVVTVGVLIAGQFAIGSRTVPRDVSPDTVAAGRALGAITPAAALFFVDAEHLDFLWLELASGAPERAVADRVFGTPEPDVQRAIARARPCATAAVRNADTRRALVAAGWHATTQHGAWTLLTAP